MIMLKNRYDVEEDMIGFVFGGELITRRNYI